MRPNTRPLCTKFFTTTFINVFHRWSTLNCDIRCAAGVCKAFSYSRHRYSESCNPSDVTRNVFMTAISSRFFGGDSPVTVPTKDQRYLVIWPAFCSVMALQYLEHESSTPNSPKSPFAITPRDRTLFSRRNAEAASPRAEDKRPRISTVSYRSEYFCLQMGTALVDFEGAVRHLLDDIPGLPVDPPSL